MAKALSVASWNVEHFGATDSRRRKPKKPVEPIVEFIASHNADVIAIYEVVSSVVYEAVSDAMPQYTFHITEGPQAQEILVGVKRTLSAFFTQKLEFKAGQATLRPGALLTVKAHGKTYPLLFLHLKSLTVPKGFGLRDDMTQRSIDFRKRLDKAAGGAGLSNYIFMGDLNTMGMNLTYSDRDVTAAEELHRLRKRAARRKMSLLEKSATETYWPGSGSRYPLGDLDHVVAADHLAFKAFGGTPVDVRGWVDEGTNAQRDAWAAKYSDHSLLYLEIQR